MRLHDPSCRVPAYLQARRVWDLCLILSKCLEASFDTRLADRLDSNMFQRAIVSTASMSAYPRRDYRIR